MGLRFVDGRRSEIPLTFRLVPSVWLSEEAGVLSCSDYDTGTPLPTTSVGRTIGAYAHLRVRVAFQPREVSRARAMYNDGIRMGVRVGWTGVGGWVGGWRFRIPAIPARNDRKHSGRVILLVVCVVQVGGFIR